VSEINATQNLAGATQGQQKGDRITQCIGFIQVVPFDTSLVKGSQACKYMGHATKSMVILTLLQETNKNLWRVSDHTSQCPPPWCHSKTLGLYLGRLSVRLLTRREHNYNRLGFGHIGKWVCEGSRRGFLLDMDVLGQGRLFRYREPR